MTGSRSDFPVGREIRAFCHQTRFALAENMFCFNSLNEVFDELPGSGIWVVLRCKAGGRRELAAEFGNASE